MIRNDLPFKNNKKNADKQIDQTNKYKSNKFAFKNTVQIESQCQATEK